MQALRQRRRSISGAFELTDNAVNDDALRSALSALDHAVKEGIELERGALHDLAKYSVLDPYVADAVAESYYIVGLLERVAVESPTDFDWPQDVATLRRSVEQHFDRFEHAFLPAAIPLLTTNDLAELDRKIGPLELFRAASR